MQGTKLFASVVAFSVTVQRLELVHPFKETFYPSVIQEQKVFCHGKKGTAMNSVFILLLHMASAIELGQFMS